MLISSHIYLYKYIIFHNFSFFISENLQYFSWFFQQQSESNESHVLLTSVSLNITGKFSCEVSADAPTFHTAFHTGEMEVVGKLYRTQGDLLGGSNISILFELWN